MAHSEDLRVRVIRAVTDGQSRRAAARRFAVSASSAVRWVSSSQEGSTGRGAGRPAGKGPLSDHKDFLIAAVEEKPDMTMPELAGWLLRARGVAAHAASLSRLLCRAGFTYKKSN